MITYRQCKMVRSREGYSETFTSWIPSFWAVISAVLRFKELGDGWRVVEVSGNAVDEDKVEMYDTFRRRASVIGIGRTG